MKFFMPERRHQLYLADILDSTRAIQSYVRDVDFKTFIGDRMRCAAVIREFEIIGQAVGKLPEAIKSEYPAVPWRDIKDFRNLLVHEYFGVDLEIVWNAIRIELPILLDVTQTILSDGQTGEKDGDAL
ncbi:DUF86 domain-containing protein [Propionivibrio sp.]|uniref:HepT-like ribonuclease domain-containing protein n=2 Tax=Propionivibrio sp. TaxID=2212460 RepID=UPI0025DF2313|nr:DUF86 domain-containing protein [Propionivibrio sp.]